MKNSINDLHAETHHFTSDEKLEIFGYGEWVEEPDHISWVYRGHECKVERVCRKEPLHLKAYFGGHLCGYVRIRPDHPYHYKIYEDMDIYCHGGLTYGECSDGHWIGFDCAHCDDYIPSMEHFKKSNSHMIKFREDFPLPEGYEKFAIFNPTYRNIEFCKDQCEYIVDQLCTIWGKKGIGKE